MKRIPYLFAICLFYYSCTSSNQENSKQVVPNLENERQASTVQPTSIVRNIKQDRNGNIWVASWDGIFKYDGKSFVNITKEVSNAHFFSVLEDEKGNFWFSTIGSGVYHFDGKKFQNFNSKDGLADNVVMEIFEAKDKTIWFSTEAGVSKYDGRTFQNFTMQDGLPNNEVYSISEDGQGRLWFGTKNGIGIYDGKAISQLKNEGKAFKNVRMIIQDLYKNMWFGGDDGLWLFKDGKLINYSPSFVGFIYPDKNGNIWTISKDQEVKKKIGDYTSKDYADSWLLSRYPVSTQNNMDKTPEVIASNETMIFGILEDNNHTIWYGTLDGVKRIAKESNSL